MASKSISMTLSLIDKATPELQKFMKGLQGLEAMLATLNKSFASFNAGMSGIQKSTEAATASMGSTASAAGSLESKIAQATAAMKAFATASGEAASAAGLASAEMNRAGSSVESFEGKMSSLGNTIRGVAEIWAASKIGHGLEEAGKNAAEYERSQARLSNLNLGTADNALLKAAAETVSANNPQINKNQALEMAHDLVNVTGSAKEAAHELEGFAKASLAIRYANPHGDIKDSDILNIAKTIELRGASMDPARMNAEMDMFTKVIAATQGRVGPSQLLGNVKYSKGGLGNTFEMDFLPQFAAMIEMMQSAGGSGGQVGVMLTTLQKLVLNGPEKERRANWANNGLLDQKGNVIGADDFQRNPYKWVQNFLKPALEKAGVDLADTARVNMILNSLSGNRNAVEGMSTMLTRSGQIDKDAALINNTAGTDEQVSRANETASAKWAALQGSLHNLSITVGEKLAPAFKVFVDLLIQGVEAVDKFASEHDLLTMFDTLGVAIGAAGLALSGFMKVFGLVGPLAAGAMGEAGVALAGFATKLGPWSLAIVGSFTVAFTLTNILLKAVGDVQVFGTTIENILNQVVANIVAAFGWLASQIAGFLGGQVKSALDTLSTGARAVGLDKVAGFFDKGSQAVSKFNSDIRESQRYVLDWRKSFTEGQSKLAQDKIAGRVDKDGNPIAAGGGIHGGDSKFDMGPPGGGWSKDNFSITPRGNGASKAKGRNIEANTEAENARFEREKTALELKATEALYREHEISLEAYFSKKVATITAGAEAEIAALEKEKAALEKDPARNADKINAANHKIIIAQMKERQDLLDVEVEKKKAIQSLTAEGLNIEQKLESLTKSASNAKIALLDIEYQKKRKLLEVNGDLRAMQALDDLHIAETAKVRYDDVQTKNSVLKSVERTAEMQANAEAKKGLISTYDAQQKIVESKREQGRQELINLDAMEQYREDIKDPAILEALKQARIEAQGLVDTLDVGAEQFKNTFHSAIEGGLNDLLNGKFSFRKFFNSISQQLNATLAKNLSETITNTLFGAGGMLQGAGGGGSMLAGLFGGGGSGGGLGALGSIFGSLFGGGSFNVGSQAAGLGMDVGSLLMSFDVGADRIPRDMIAQIHKDEMILPAGTANKVRNNLASGGGSGGSVNQTNHFHMPQGGYDRRTQDQVAKTALQAAQRAGRRDG